ncbi:MAG TPA: helix-turn-helix domain-containing protein [Candidatus Fimiplasma intestinipullorum]|uniref:Helix-turn-helix domain-containing protein n=1 Tax=Candidatus Fimiplasma intestinipullorum TaxID=2840825 RepID=A0A9D1KZJ4_9FIRM|nr:helix-turn-helix domain-containing protein [Candidatus Fimiplasma intestinipullorum]
MKIVRYCLEHERDYKLTAKVFDIPYANVYGWVKKYIQKGEERLSDKRGCHKKDEELDEVYLLKRQLKQMEREYEILKLENELLKKVQEVERRRSGEKAGMKQSLSQSGKRPKR